MTNNQPNLDDGTIPFPLRVHGNLFFVDNSSLTTFMQCPRAAGYSVALRRQLNVPRAALHFGAAIHCALEVRYRSGQKMVDAKLQQKMFEELIDLYTETPGPDGDYRNLDLAIKVVRNYNAEYPYDSITPIEIPQWHGVYESPKMVPAVEVPFALPIGEIPVNDELIVSDPDINDGQPVKKFFEKIVVVFTGKMDVLGRYKGHPQHIYLVDHKTTSMGGQYFFEEFYVSNQFKGYKYAGQRILGQPIAGVIINGIVVRRPKADGTSSMDFMRETVYIPDPNVKEWERSFLETVSDYIHSVQRQYFPMHTCWCKGKYGKCEYFEVCNMQPHQRFGMLASSVYQDNTWSPIESTKRTHRENLRRLAQEQGGVVSYEEADAAVRQQLDVAVGIHGLDDFIH